jgi:hypothetical protein
VDPASKCVAQIPDAGALATCIEDKSFKDHFDDIAELFCGGGAPMDAGGGAD